MRAIGYCSDGCAIEIQDPQIPHHDNSAGHALGGQECKDAPFLGKKRLADFERVAWETAASNREP